MDEWFHLVQETDDWRAYEQGIYERLRDEFPDCQIEFDVKVEGRMSGAPRQLDVSIRGNVAGYPAFGVVECRSRSRPTDVSEIDRLAGFLEDVGADFGIMVTRAGYSKAARRRAEHAHMKLDVLCFLDLADYEFEWDVCEMCDPGPERPPAVIYFDATVPPLQDEGDVVAEVGWCDWCNGISVRCAGCSTVTPAWEADYDSPVECQGGCGMRFKVVTGYVDGCPGYHVEILPSIELDSRGRAG